MNTPKQHDRKLRRLHGVFVELGFVLSLLLLIVAFRVNYRTDVKLNLASEPNEAIDLIPIPQTKLAPKPPPPPVPPVPIEVPNNEELTLEPLNLNSEINLNESASVPTSPPPAPKKKEGNGNEIFVVVEDYPKPVGGMEGILSRVKYPEIARKAGVEGTVIVQFVIEKDGSVSHPEVLKGIGAGCDKAAVQAIKNTKWTPGMQRKKPVRVKMTIPIRFHLK